MHSPTVSQEVVKNVRANGIISHQEFGKLILHWFPGAWTLFFTLKRQACPKPKTEKHDDDDTIPIRFLNALRDKIARPQESLVGPHVVRAMVSDMIGTQAREQVYEIMASDAMHQCAEQMFGAHLYLEDEETLVLIPDGIKSPPVQLAPLSTIEERYHSSCERIRTVLTGMEEAKRGFGQLDCTKLTQTRAELIRFMAIRAYRLRLEREYGVEFAYQWPGIIACARRDSAEELEHFRSCAEQILAIHRAAF